MKDPDIESTEPTAKSDEALQPIPVMRPLLPPAADIVPYLEEIDRNRWYSNLGPLACRFEDRLGEHFRSGPGSMAAVSNGTAGLTLALKAVGAPSGALCMLPAFTFTASASAVLAAGLVPWFVDVDPDSWALEPHKAMAYLRLAPGRVGAVMPVSVFGRPVGVAQWDEFAGTTGIPAVIDGAASFDAAEVGRSPVVLSLHGTKVFGVGEGGLVMSRDSGLVSRVHSLSNFGFPIAAGRKIARRSAVLPGLNGKFSEYAAAVGLAGLDSWTMSRARFLAVRDDYLEVMTGLPGLQPQPGGWDPWVSATINFSVAAGRVKSLITGLEQRNIQARSWWGDGCHAASAFESCPKTALPVTEDLVNRVIGLPFYADMTHDEILRVRTALSALLI
jgi:dTDP-4-amino-4,6-dideoxygalactose transaminase